MFSFTLFELLLPISLFALLIIRILPIFLWDRDPVDAYSHMYYSKCIQNNNGLIPKFINRVKPRTEFSYPWGVAWILSKINIKNPISVGAYFNLVISLIEVVVSVAFILFFLNYFEIDVQKYDVVLVIIGFYIALPQVVSTWSGVYGLNARPLAALLVNISVMSLIFGIYAESWFLVVPIFILPVIIIFSKFGVQSILVSFFALGFITSSLLPIAILIASFLFSYLLLRKHMITIIKGSYMHSKFYAQFLQFIHIATSVRCQTVTQWFMLFYKRNISIPKLLSQAYWVPTLRAIFLNPWIIYIIWILINYYPILSEMEKTILQFVLFAYLLVGIINVKGLRFLGEADRYLYFFTTVGMVILISLNINTGNDYIIYGVCLLISLINILLMIITQSRFRANTNIKYTHDLAIFLNNKTTELNNIITIPTNITQKLIPFVNSNFVGLYMNVPFSNEGQSKLKSLYPVIYPYPTTNFNTLKSEFSISYLVYSKRYCKDKYLNSHYLGNVVIKYPKTKVLFENKEYVVYGL
jgi:hypothetical protein